MAIEAQEATQDGDPKSWIPLGNAAGPAKPESAAMEFVGPRAYGRLMLLKALARGGMGEVYLAALGDIEGAERPCVVKLIRHEHRDDASFLARFLDEARIQAQMQHPGVAQVLEAAIDPEGRPYVVVEYVAGRDLAEIRQRASQLKLQISWSDAVAIIASIGEALAHVHEQTDSAGRPLDVVHRDLSPQNVMVSYVGDTKLIDFGTARGENRRCQTIAGIVFAKPGYVAPEVAANNPGGAAADLYALGIVLWELIAGRRFLQGDSQEHLAAVAKGERTPPALSLWLAVPRELDTIIGRLTATKIEDRFSSAREATEQLAKLLQQAPGLANGERSVRARVAHLMLRLYPAEPARSRAEFAQLLTLVRKSGGIRPDWSGSPHPAVVEARDSLFPGTRYRVVREVAHGPMSVVLEAQHVDLGRKVALKVLDRQRCQSAEAEARFRREARVVAQLRHDNLVQIHDFGVSSDGRPYYAMEYLEGESLAERLARRGRLPWLEVVELGIQACQALEAAHALGIIHRDIKPANLFVTTAGTVKLLDFGITQTEAEPERSNTESQSLSLIGTPEYMAPEQIGRAAVDARADVYALGAVLYELLTGCLPHTGPNTVALLDNKVHDKVKAPSQRVRKLRLPRYLDRILLTALATEVQHRYDNITGLRQDLVWISGSKARSQVSQRRWLVGGMAMLGAGSMLALIALEGLPERLQVTALRPLASQSAEPAAALAPTLAPAERAPQGAAAGVDLSRAAPVPEAEEPATLAQATLDTESLEADAPAADAPAADAPAAETPAAVTPSAVTPAIAARVAAALAVTPVAQQAPALVAAPPAKSAPVAAKKTAAAAKQERTATLALAATTPKPSAVSRPKAPIPTDDDETADRDEPEAPAVVAPPRRPAAVPAKAADPELENALAQAESLIGQNDLRALEAFRRLGRRYPREPKVLEGWSTIAASTKWWGESLRAAERWAAVDASAPAQIHLARTQKRLGQVDKAIATLKTLLAKNPRDREATNLLSLYGGNPIALR